MLNRFGRKYFVKGLREDMRGDTRLTAALNKEFDLGVRLDHPGCVRVASLENFVQAGLCIVMEWIEGTTLAEWIETSPSPAARIRMAEEIADALAYMATAGVCHRDLKPDNIMVTTSLSRAKIIDFGLGDSDDFSLLKESGATRRYGAPEQQDGMSQGGPAADVYSLGCILADLRLPLRYRPLIRKCRVLQPDARPSMPEVARAIHAIESRHRRLPMVTGITVAVVSLLIASASLWLMHPQGGSMVETTKPETVFVSDVSSDTIHTSPTIPEAATTEAEQPAVVDKVDSNKKFMEDSFNATCREIENIYARYAVKMKQANADGDIQAQTQLALDCNKEVDAAVEVFKKKLRAKDIPESDIDTQALNLYYRNAKKHPAAAQ